MEEEKQSSYFSLFFILFVIAAILFLQYAHRDFSLVIPEHNRPIVLIYDTLTKPSIKMDLFQDTANNFSDTVEFSIDSIQTRSDTLQIPATSIEIETQVDSDSIYFARLLEKYIQRKKTRKDKPVIRYYVKPKDGKAVYDLRDYGYYIHKRESPNLTDFTSNLITYGDSIKNEDLKLILYVLISQGMNVQEVALSRYHDGWKYNAIEIGTDTTITEKPSIEISDIRKMFSDE